MPPTPPTGQPVYILKEGTERVRGGSAQANNILAATAIADVVRSTLGPRGMDKMLVDASGEVVITNDGATILKEMDVAHPAAKMLIEVAKTQDTECGDGTKTSVLLTGELLRMASKLIDDGVHSSTIVTGYQHAAKEALRILEAIAKPIGAKETELLKHISNTSLYSKNLSHDADLISGFVVQACTAVAESRAGRLDVDLDNILVQKCKGRGIEDTTLVQGIILDKQRAVPAMPQRVANARIALLDSALEVRKTEVSEEIRIREPGQLEAFTAQEDASVKAMVDKVKAAGANVVVTPKGIGDLAQHYLAQAGIYAVSRAKKSDMEKLAKATGGILVSTLDDLAAANLGKAGLVEERKFEDEHLTFVTDCASPKAVSILLRGATPHVVEEAERALHDALSVVAVALREGKMTAGGGAWPVEVAMGLRSSAGAAGLEQLAIEAFADAVEVIPRALATNAGLDEIDVLMALRTTHKKGNRDAGIDLDTGDVADMMARHVIEPLKVATQEIKSATEAAAMILRIDDVIAAKPFTAPSTGSEVA